MDACLNRSPFDAQKSSANTNDLWEKNLRIKVDGNGDYSLPNDNLFPKDGSKGRPEIYVVGVRNPFSIRVFLEEEVTDNSDDSTGKSK